MYNTDTLQLAYRQLTETLALVGRDYDTNIDLELRKKRREIHFIRVRKREIAQSSKADTLPLA